MELQFDITRQFEKDLRRLSKEDERRVSISIDRYAAAFDPERDSVTEHIYQIKSRVLGGGLDSSLYVLRSSPRLRVILTIENDPLFGKKIVTLLRIVAREKLDKAFDSVSESLYQHFISESQSNG